MQPRTAEGMLFWLQCCFVGSNQQLVNCQVGMTTALSLPVTPVSQCRYSIVVEGTICYASTSQHIGE